ncbi:neuropeptide Y receptor type 2 [Danio rerio]|uniref:Neuropeptide Y receptor type 2 n=1 Tax=Danio rerio TaxID=7955 RepID=A0A8M9PJD0_DANRE|nr:neuropeptide Y receptor type 2 [Danio rerio]|eukprot:XP_001343301.3 neuropeptide Y receptor type 2 [Danio rerio]
MDVRTQINTSEDGTLSQLNQSTNCCAPDTAEVDAALLDGLEDSTKLVGVQVILILAYSTIIFFGMTGNSLVIYVVYKFRNLHTVTNYFIVNLAVADLLVNTLCLPFTLMYTLYGEWKFGQVMCYLLPYAQGLAVHVSTITLNVIALDRYRSIVYHMETKMSKDMCVVVIAITWVASAILASPLAIFREYVTFDLSPEQTIQGCAEKWPGSSTDGTIYSIAMFFLQYGLPLSIISFAYTRIWNKLRNHVSPGGGRSDRHQRRQKTTKMLVAVVVVFTVSWLPFHAFQLAVDIDSSVLEMKDFKLLYTAFHIVAMCSTFANPILYGWMNRNYRGSFVAVFKCGRINNGMRRVSSSEAVREKCTRNLENTISIALTQANTLV